MESRVDKKTKKMFKELNPSVKIITALIIYLLILINTNYNHYLFLSIILGLIALTSSQIKKIIKSIPFILYFWSFFLIVNLILYNSEPYFVNLLGFKISEVAIKLSFNSLWRIVLISFSSIILMGGLEEEELIHGFERLVSPLAKIKINTRIISTIFMLAISSIPLLFKEIKNIRKAQSARGIDIYSKNIIKRVKYMGLLIVPLLYGLFIRAEELIITMEIRKYDPLTSATVMYQEKYKIQDYLWLTGLGFCCLGYFLI